MFFSTRLTAMTSLRITSLIWLLISILAPYVMALEVYSDMQCQDLCLRDSSCRTYNTGPMEASGKMKCNFNPASSGKRLELRDQIINACLRNPCQHGGRCYEDVTKCRRMHCSCKKNWTGPNCELKVRDVLNGRAIIPECPAY